MDDQIDSIIYLPVSTDWQHKKCRLLGLSYIHSNNIMSKDPVRIGISQSPVLWQHSELKEIGTVKTLTKDGGSMRNG